MSRRQRKINQHRREVEVYGDVLKALCRDIDESSKRFQREAEEFLYHLAGKRAVEKLRKKGKSPC